MVFNNDEHLSVEFPRIPSLSVFIFDQLFWFCIVQIRSFVDKLIERHMAINPVDKPWWPWGQTGVTLSCAFFARFTEYCSCLYCTEFTASVGASERPECGLSIKMLDTEVPAMLQLGRCCRKKEMASRNYMIDIYSIWPSLQLASNVVQEHICDIFRFN